MQDNMILMAARLAVDAHNGQTRKWGHSNDPYILHPIRTAGLVAISLYATENMVAAAYLHDVLEDTTVTAEQLLAKGVGGEVVYFVEQLTNPKLPDISRAEKKRLHCARLSAAIWEVRLIKLCDRIDNVRELNQDSTVPRDFDALYRKESMELLEALGDVDGKLESELAMLIGSVKA